jgi:hypothetical protein
MQDLFPTRLLAAAGSGRDAAQWVFQRLLLEREKPFFEIHGIALDILWMGMIYSLLRRYERCSASVRCRVMRGMGSLRSSERALRDFPKFAEKPLTNSREYVIISGRP